MKRLVALCLTSLACSSSPPAPGSVRSDNWGFSAVVPSDMNLVFVGPPTSSCDSSAPGARVILRPSGAADSTSADTVQVRFTRALFEDVAMESGFFKDDSTGMWRSGGSEFSGDGQHKRYPRRQTLEGMAMTRVDFPNATLDEPPFVFEDITLSLASFDRPDGCALVLLVRQIGGPSADSLFSSVSISR